MASASPAANCCSRERYFRTAVEAILKNWTALQLAVHQASAGRDSQAIADWLVDAACHWVSTNKDLAISEVVDFFESILYQEMHLLIEDGSTEEVANLILDFYVKCSTLNEEDVIAAVRTLPKCDLSKCQVTDQSYGEATAPEPIEMDTSDQLLDAIEGMVTEDERPQEEPSGPDPDGWEVVKSTKKKPVKKSPAVRPNPVAGQTPPGLNPASTSAPMPNGGLPVTTALPAVASVTPGAMTTLPVANSVANMPGVSSVPSSMVNSTPVVHGQINLAPALIQTDQPATTKVPLSNGGLGTSKPENASQAAPTAEGPNGFNNPGVPITQPLPSGERCNQPCNGL